MRTILITGGAGFIGSHLSERLLKEGNKVLVIDNFNNYYDPAIKRSNVEEVKKTCIENNISLDNYKVFEGDIRDNEFLKEVFSNKIDSIMHLAAMAGVRPSIQDPSLFPYTDELEANTNCLTPFSLHLSKRLTVPVIFTS